MTRGEVFCTQCGRKTRPGAKFCAECGAPLYQSQTAGSSDRAASREDLSRGRPLLRSRIWPILAAIVVVLVVGGIVGAVLLSRHGEQATGSDATTSDTSLSQATTTSSPASSTTLNAHLQTTSTAVEAESASQATYTDDTYHYTFEYPSAWQIQEGDTAEVSAGGASAASVGVYDPKGAVAGETYIDMVQVSVYELNVTVDESLMPEIRAEVEAVLKSLQSQAADLQTVEPLSEVSVGDMRGYKVTYGFAKNSAPVTSTLYFMFFGDKEYQITVQAADENWEANQGIFNALLTSFEPEDTIRADETVVTTGSSDAIETPPVLEEGVLQAGSDTAFPPMEFSDGQGGYIGFEVDLCAAIAQKMGLRLEVVPTPWNGIISALKDDKFDIIMSTMSITPERLEQVNFSDSHLPNILAISTPKDKPIVDAASLAGKIVGVQGNTTGQFAVEEIAGVKEMRKYGSILEAFGDMYAGRVDAVVNDEPINVYIIATNESYNEMFANTGSIATGERYGFAIKKENAALQAAINAALRELRDEGTHQKILDKWGLTGD